MQIIGVSRTSLWRLEKAGKLPPKIIISERVCGWRQSDVDDWLEKRTTTPLKLDQILDNGGGNVESK